LINFDLRKKFSAGQKSAITKLWSATEKIHGRDIVPIKVSKSTDSGHRFRIKNTVFVSRDGAESVRYSKRTGTITKTIRQKGAKKIIRAPMSPRPEHIPTAFARLKPNEAIYIRSADAGGLTQPAIAYTDLQSADRYLANFQGSKYAEEFNRLRAAGVPPKKAEKQALKNVQTIVEGWYASRVEYETEEEMPRRFKRDAEYLAFDKSVAQAIEKRRRVKKTRRGNRS
jgi:hypothetical protein